MTDEVDEMSAASRGSGGAAPIAYLTMWQAIFEGEAVDAEHAWLFSTRYKAEGMLGEARGLVREVVIVPAVQLEIRSGDEVVCERCARFRKACADAMESIPIGRDWTDYGISQ